MVEAGIAHGSENAFPVVERGPVDVFAVVRLPEEEDLGVS